MLGSQAARYIGERLTAADYQTPQNDRSSLNGALGYLIFPRMKKGHVFHQMLRRLNHIFDFIYVVSIGGRRANLDKATKFFSRAG
jgi:hypothetical protein